MVFSIAKALTSPPTEALRIGANGNVYISGSLIVSGGTVSIQQDGIDDTTFDINGGSF